MSMENPLEEGDEASGDRRGGIVPGYDNEELFEYCFDQLMNGTRDDRREVVDYLVDEFDEMSLWMVEGFTKFANRDAPQDHQQVDREDQNDVIANTESLSLSYCPFPQASTSNQTRKSSRLAKKRPSNVTNQQENEDEQNSAIDDTERRDNERKRERRHEYDLKYWQQLKKNPVKYAKVLKHVRDYRARRLEQMTDEEKEAYIERKREKDRNRYRNLSLEMKTKPLENAEFRQKERENKRRYRAKMTEQQKAQRRAQERERHRRKLQNMTEDELKVARQKRTEAQRKRRNAAKMKKSQK